MAPNRLMTLALIFCAGAAPTLAHETLTPEAITAAFSDAAILSGPDLVDCTLSGEEETMCFSITVRPVPATRQTGPWCPRNASDGPESSGIWLEGGTVYDADGAFMSNLPTFYDDDKWNMVDPDTGDINVTETAEQCAAAARPDVGPECANYCVECRVEFLEDDASMTYVIPLDPIDASQESDIRLSGAGVAFDGVRLDGPAPTDAILGAYTVAPFDDCGGHVNLFAGYHYHAVTACQEGTSAVSTLGDRVAEAAPIGIAMDGHLILAHELADGSAPQGLDQCQGHETDRIGYHYHAGEPGSNRILGCLTAQYGCTSGDQDAACDASAPTRRP